MDRETWEREVYGPLRGKHPERKETVSTSSGIEIDAVYGDHALPGVYPYERGIRPNM